MRGSWLIMRIMISLCEDGGDFSNNQQGRRQVKKPRFKKQVPSSLDLETSCKVIF